MGFAPALRGMFSPVRDSKALAAALESKSVTLAGYESLTAINGHAGIFLTSSSRADSWDMERAVLEYERSVWTYRCIEKYASTVAKRPYAAATGRDTPEEQRIENHPLFRVLNKRANPLETGRAFKKRISAQAHLSKKGVFVEVGKTNAGNINRLDLLHPARVNIERSDDGTYIKYFEYTDQAGQTHELPPERVRWIREPHPTDEFSGTTPLEAAGLSVQLDMLSRLYNVSFIQNDSRPGGILAVDTATLTDQEMNRLERKFRPGAHHAGELEVIASGTGGLNYIDTTTKPRDMAYGEAARNAKIEVLSAFGMGESVIASAADRTFDNADAENYNWWTGSLSDHFELIASAFDQDIPEEADGFFDTTGVAILELPKEKAREEARTEVREGLRTIDEYRPLAGLDSIGVAQTRAIWISPAKAPIPTRPEDREALGLEPIPGADAGAAPVDTAEVGGTPQDAVAEARAMDTAPLPGTPEEAVAEARGIATVDPDAVDEPAMAVEEARAATSDDVAAPEPVPTDPRAVVEQARLEKKSGVPGVADTPADFAAVERLRQSWSHGKMAAQIGWGTGGDFDRCVTLATEHMGAEDAKGWCNLRHHDALGIYPATHAKMEGKSLEGQPVTYDVGAQQQASAELAIAAALEMMLARQSGVVAARVEAPKSRQGTKFWTAAYAGDPRAGAGPIDADQVVQGDKWAGELTDTLAPVLMVEATRPAEGMYEQLEAAGLIASALGVGGVAAAAQEAAVKSVLAAVTLAHEALDGLLGQVRDLIRNESLVAPTAGEVAAKVREFYARKSGPFSRSLASTLAGVTLNGATEAAALRLAPVPGVERLDIVKTWRGIPDSQIRDTHREATGQTVPLIESFRVGAETLRYPNDPQGSPAETRGCRCRIEYRFAAGQRLLLPPT